MMDKFPSMIRSVNDGLDEILSALDKVNLICSSAEQMSPVLKQLARIVNEHQSHKPQTKQVRVSGVNRGNGQRNRGSRRKR